MRHCGFASHVAVLCLSMIAGALDFRNAAVPSAWGQHPSHEERLASPSPIAAGLTSKDYLRMMAEANKARERMAGSPPASPQSLPPQSLPPQAVPAQGIPAQVVSFSQGVAPVPEAPGLSFQEPPSLPEPIPFPNPPPTYPTQPGLPPNLEISPQHLEVPPTYFVPPAGNTSEQFVVPDGMDGPLATRPPNAPPGRARQDFPRLMLGYDAWWLRRSGDESTTYSNGGELGSFGEERAGAYRVGWYYNPMERIEFAYLGTLDWERHLRSEGPVNSLLVADASEPFWLDNLNQAAFHEQSHTATLRSFELNKRWIADDIGNCFFGLHVIDYQESYALHAEGAGGAASFAIDTTNLLAGAQTGIEFWRPLSQRFSVGVLGTAGLYGNFADGEWRLEDPSGGRLVRADDTLRVAGTVCFDAKLRYQLTSRLQAFGGYRWWCLAGLATVDDQTPSPIGSQSEFSLNTDEAFLLQGATCGLEFNY